MAKELRIMVDVVLSDTEDPKAGLRMTAHRVISERALWVGMANVLHDTVTELAERLVLPVSEAVGGFEVGEVLDGED